MFDLCAGLPDQKCYVGLSKFIDDDRLGRTAREATMINVLVRPDSLFADAVIHSLAGAGGCEKWAPDAATLSAVWSAIPPANGLKHCSNWRLAEIRHPHTRSGPSNDLAIPWRRPRINVLRPFVRACSIQSFPNLRPQIACLEGCLVGRDQQHAGQNTFGYR